MLIFFLHEWLSTGYKTVIRQQYVHAFLGSNTFH